MKRLFLFLVLWALPQLGFAQSNVVRVQSGEHAGFSRLVFLLPESVDWSFGRMADGYGFQTTLPNVTFDLSTIYDLMPRDRISNVTSPAPSQLILSIDCDCIGDAFEIRGGMVVVDIKDDKRNARFEQPIVFAAPAVLETKSEPADQLIDQVEIPKPATVTHTDLQSPPDKEPPNTEAAQPNEAERDENIALFRSVVGTADTKNHGIASVQFAVPETETTPANQEPAAEIAASPTERPDVETNRLDEAAIRRAQEVQDQLIQQLQRSANQGFLELPDTQNPLEDAKTSTEADPADEPADTLPEPDGDGTHMRVQTARDAAVDQMLAGVPSSRDGGHCLDGNLFSVADWGNQILETDHFEDLRMHLSMEFDEPNPEAVLGLARRYVFLGFGQEAMVLHDLFRFEGPEFAAVTAIAHTIDYPASGRPEWLVEQVTCPNDAALWAALATQAPFAGLGLDHRSALHAFSKLPLHLRVHLGPHLAEKFIEAGDQASATAVGNAISRAAPSAQGEGGLTEARILADRKEVSAADAVYQYIIGQDNSESPQALIELINLRIENDLPGDSRFAQIAEALAFEHRGSDLGLKLTFAAIMGFAHGGVPKRALELADLTEERGDFSKEQMADMHAAAHLQNVRNSSDTTFLDVAFRHDVRKSGDDIAGFAAKIETAERLLQMGMVAKAKAVVPSLPADDERVRMLAAQIALAENDTELVRDLVGELATPEAQLLVAQSYQSDGNFAAAAPLFSSVEDHNRAAAAAWISGELGDEALKALHPVAPLAQELVTLAPAPDRPVTGQTDTADQDGELTRAQSMLSESEKTRTIIHEILEK